MEIRNILLALSPYAPGFPQLGSAIVLGQTFDARISVCAAAAPSLVYAGAEMGVAAAALYDQERKEIDERLAMAEAAFESKVPLKMRGRFSGLMGEPTRFAIERAAGADLVLLTSGEPSGHTEVDPGEVIVAGGRPVLLIPQGANGVDARRVVVAWKDTREARRAVADALPFLKAAEEVFVLCVEEGDYNRVQPSFKDVMAWMETHAVKASGEIVPLRTTVREAVEDAATAHKAGFIVSGGYGHARMREWLLGGVTRDLLDMTTRARLFSN